MSDNVADSKRDEVSKKEIPEGMKYQRSGILKRRKVSKKHNPKRDERFDRTESQKGFSCGIGYSEKNQYYKHSFHFTVLMPIGRYTARNQVNDIHLNCYYMKKCYFFAAGLSALALTLGSLAVTAGPSSTLPFASGVSVLADASLTPVSVKPANNSTVALWNAPKVVTFLFADDISVVRDGGAKAMIVTPMMFGGGYTVQKEILASDEGALYVDPFNPRQLMLNVSDFEFEDKSTGYTIMLEEGLISSNGVLNAECQTHLLLVNTPQYTTVPASGTTLAMASEFDNITVTFSGELTTLNFAEDKVSLRPVVKLYQVENGVRTQVGKYTAAIDGLNLNLTLDGAAPEAGGAGVTYEVEVPAGLLNFLNHEDYAGGNVTILIDDLKLSQSTVEWGEISDYIGLSLPTSLEANRYNTVSAFGNVGMGVVGFGLKTADFVGISNAAPVTYTYQAEENGEAELLTSIPTAENGRILFMSRGALDDSGLLTFPASHFMYFMMAGDEEGTIDEEVLPKFKREGYYTITIPDGAFMAEDKMLKGTSITFHYVAEGGAKEYEYELTPADGAEFTKAAEVFGPNGTGIILKFKDCSFVDCDTNPATLTMPDGTVLKKNSPYTSNIDQFKWTFGTATTNWTDGTYTFTVIKGKIGIDMGWADEWDGEEGNFDGLTAVYKVQDSSVMGVTLIGVEAADSYTVYTLSGAVVKENVKAEGLLDLEPGLYIVNGKKTIVRK